MDSKREKYKAAFKVSKAKVKLWENQFVKENNRKPSKADHKLAPENIQVCFKNCWKIKAYFDDEEKKSKKGKVVLEMEDEGREEGPSFSGIFTSTAKPEELERLLPKDKSPCSDISNLPAPLPSSLSTTLPSSFPSSLPSKGVWGAHLNKQPVAAKRVGQTNFEKLSTKLALQVTSSSTRKSLKKKGGVKRSTSFFDTLGDSQDLSLSTPSPLPLPLPLPPSFVDTQGVNEAGQEVKETGQEVKEAGQGERSKRSSGSGGEEDSGLDLFPSLAAQPRVVDMLQATQATDRAPQTTPSASLARTVDSAWLARCGAPAPTEDAPAPRTTFPGALQQPLPQLGAASWASVGWGGRREEPVYTVPEQEERGEPEEQEWDERDSSYRPPVGSLTAPAPAKPAPAPADPPAPEDPPAPAALPAPAAPGATSPLGPLARLQPAYKLNKVQQVKMTIEELEAAEEDERNCEDDSDYEPEKRSPRPVAEKGKRKRSVSSDSEEEAAMFYPECGMEEVEEEEVEEEKPKKTRKKATTAGKKAAKGGRAKKKKKLDDDVPDEEAVDEEEDDGAKEPEGPEEMNLFALGFEETAAREVTVKKSMSQGERLAMKVSTGKASDNFIKIDLKKKSFSKGKNSGARMKRFEYKNKLAMKEGTKVKEYKCFRCGETGHWANQCTGGAGDRLIPSAMAEEFDPGDFPTLDQARDMACGVLPSSQAGGPTRLFTPKPPVVQKETTADTKAVSDAVPAPAAEMDVADEEEGSPQPEEEVHDESHPVSVVEEPCLDFEAADDAGLLEACRQFECAAPESAAERYAVPPLEVGPEEVRAALAKWGHDGFRPGQEEAVVRILRGESTLVLLATGTGKSLIYQLPALMYREAGPCITLVVSPLVSLMEDQVTGLPNFLKAAALHYNMTKVQKDKVCEQVKSGRLHFLLVSPEAVAGGGGAFGSLLRHLPPIAFVCIDEAHCVSHWSHNFRPSYLRLAKIIREKLGVKTILGLTATAPECITRSVMDHLGVPDGGVIRGPLLPGNLTLTASRDVTRDRALVEMLGEGSLADCDSVIVYCTRRDECERLATLIRTHLQARDMQQEKAKQSARARLSVTAEPYHAGMTSHRRKTVQNTFMSGKLRVVVATVAFGMGIDKSDIRAIVHYNMPKAFESYIQEIGRAGRDGLPARGHLFLDSRPGGDQSELRRHIFSNSVDRHTIAKLLRAVFPAGREGARGQFGEMAVSVADLVEQLDLPEENISTLLCYLENHNPPYLNLENHVYCKAKVQCYGGPRQLRVVAARSPPLAAAIAILRQGGMDITAASSVEFQVVEVAAKMNWSSSVVKKELKNLEWQSSGSGWKKTGVVVEFSDLAFHFFSALELGEEEQDSLLDELYRRVEVREMKELSGLARLAKAFSCVSYGKEEEQGEGDQARSDKLKGFIREYFTEADRGDPEPEPRVETCEHEAHVRGAIRAFVMQHQEHTWSGRAVARIFHGIQSPNFPAKQWGRVRGSWRRHLDVDFNLLVRLATQEVLNLRKGR